MLTILGVAFLVFLYASLILTLGQAIKEKNHANRQRDIYAELAAVSKRCGEYEEHLRNCGQCELGRSHCDRGREILGVAANTENVAARLDTIRERETGSYIEALSEYNEKVTEPQATRSFSQYFKPGVRH